MTTICFLVLTFGLLLATFVAHFSLPLSVINTIYVNLKKQIINNIFLTKEFYQHKMEIAREKQSAIAKTKNSNANLQFNYIKSFKKVNR